jgi:hypothetical protein
VGGFFAMPGCKVTPLRPFSSGQEEHARIGSASAGEIGTLNTTTQPTREIPGQVASHGRTARLMIAHDLPGAA